MKFALNFIISLLGYAVVNVIGYLMRYILYPDIGLWWEWGISLSSNKWPAWIQFIMYVIWLFLNIGVPCILYFVLGTKLKLLDNQLHNFLSVTSSFVFVAILVLLRYAFNLTFIHELLWNSVASFGYGINIIGRVVKKLYVTALIVAILPSINIWLGMLWKARKI